MGDKRKRTVLLVHDPNAARFTLQRALEKREFEVRVAANEREAIVQMQFLCRPVDVFVLDLMMGTKLGTEIAELLQPLAPRARRVFTSTYPFYALTGMGIPVDPYTYIPKPFVESDLEKVFGARFAT